VSLSDSGDILAIGAFGAIYLFSLNINVYVQYYPTIPSLDHNPFGYCSIDTSGPGTTLVVGSVLSGAALSQEGATFVYDVNACNKTKNAPLPLCGISQTCTGTSTPAKCVASRIPVFTTWAGKTSGKLISTAANIQISYVLTNAQDTITNVFLNGSNYSYASGPNNQKELAVKMLSNRSITVTFNSTLPPTHPLLLYLYNWPVGHYLFSQTFTLHSHSAGNFTITNANNLTIHADAKFPTFSGIFQFQDPSISNVKLKCTSVSPTSLSFTFATLQYNIITV